MGNYIIFNQSSILSIFLVPLESKPLRTGGFIGFCKGAKPWKPSKTAIFFFD